VFEPTHGSAPKYAGQHKVNPIAMLLTTKLMLDWLKEADMATRLDSAIARVIAEGKCVDTDSPWRGRQKIPRSMWPKPSPITPARRSEDRHPRSETGKSET
jgi:hypothetical protein